MEAINLINKCLQKEPSLRPSIIDIKKDPFFNNINWEKLLKK